MRYAKHRMYMRCSEVSEMSNFKLTIPLIIGACTFSCTENKSTTQPTSWSQQARDDPFNYSPHMDRTDISGGGLMDYDKNAMKRDINDVLNP